MTGKIRPVLLGFKGNERAILRDTPAKRKAYEALRSDDGVHLRAALSPIKGSSGFNLAQILGMSAAKFDDKFDRLNFYDDVTSPCLGNMYFRREIVIKLLQGRDVIALGGQVGHAFGLDLFGQQEINGLRILSLPHPSGLNRMFNDEMIRLKTKSLLENFICPCSSMPHTGPSKRKIAST